VIPRRKRSRAAEALLVPVVAAGSSGLRMNYENECKNTKQELYIYFNLHKAHIYSYTQHTLTLTIYIFHAHVDCKQAE